MPQKFTSNSLTIAVLILLFPFFIISCKHKRKVIYVDPSFSTYIEGYTSGVIPKKSTIKIQLTSAVSTVHSTDEMLPDGIFNISPNVEGKAYWVDAHTIEFKPDRSLNSDEFYEVDFRLDKIAQVPKQYNSFRFNIQTLKPSFKIIQTGLRTTGKETMELKGQIQTADAEEAKKVESIINASFTSSELTVRWQHDERNLVHDFTIENIHRAKQQAELKIKCDGTPIHSNKNEDLLIQVPAIGDFKVLDIQKPTLKNNYVSILFSDNVASDQLLDGLIGISNQEHLSYAVNGNEVKVFSADKFDGNYTVSVNEGIQNTIGDKIKKTFTGNFFIDNNLPSVKIHGRGVILPNSGSKIVLPFDATNLKAVDVSIIKIYENNIPQFFQSNTMDGEDELRKVAKPIVQAVVKLDDDKNLNLRKQNRFALDLDKYIKTEPGAIYRVSIGFRPDYSLSVCRGGITVQKNEDNEEEDYDYERPSKTMDDDFEFWSRYNTYYPYGINWEQKDDPCASSYYNRERFAFRNILSSNIGLTVKKGNDNHLLVFVNNLINTASLPDVDIQVLDYQQQIVGTGKSDATGMASVEVTRKPYLMIAKKGSEKSYLRLDDGSSLPLSHFDVAGVDAKTGIKGFIFGERGVWRPGDSIYLTCLIEDKAKTLPVNHPIEMQLFTPKGQLYKRIVSKNNDDGFNVFKTATDENAQTGNWICRVKIGGATFEKTLKIETVMPNRLKLDLNFGKLKALGKNSNSNGTLTAKWLFGAVAQNLKARVDVQLYKRTTKFDGFNDYVFDDPTTAFNTISKTVFDGSLNSSGVANISSMIDSVDEAPGMLIANMNVKVFEPGGNFSIDHIAMPYNPYESYAGVKVPAGNEQWGFLSNNKTQSFGIVNVNTNGELVKGNSLVDVTLYKVQWKWWWDNSGGEVSNFSESEYNKVIQKQSIQLANGRGVFNYKFPQNTWGRFILIVKDRKSGHQTGKFFYVDDDDWNTRSDNYDASAVAMLAFSSDKKKYNTGEEVKITIPSSKNGRALVSLETGSKVLKTFWVPTQQGETKFSFKAEKGMSPNIYINVSLLQPHAQTINDLPIRMYGVIPIEVEDKENILKPVIKIADVIKPEQNNIVSVSEENNRPFNYVIAIVDDGLLDLTQFKTPNPYNAFYAKEALGIKSWDVYDYVIGAWGSELERILTIGGDAEALLAAKTRRANRFKPVVKFLGPFKYEGGTQSHHFELPPYMGSVRAMVIAANNGAYGVAEKTVTVKKPLMLFTTIPRVLAPNEEFRLPVTVFATDNAIKTVKILVHTNGLVDVVNTQDLNFTASGEQTVYLTGKVKSNTGIAKIKVTAQSGSEETSSEVELDVRNPNPQITQVTDITLKPGETYTGSVSVIGDGVGSKATLELSSIPGINLEKRLSYLIQYPYGCIEQMTSTAFSQLVLNDLIELTKDQKTDIYKNIQNSIQKLQNFQTEEGGFSYWPLQGKSDEWGSNYAGNFLMECSQKGYTVPQHMIQQWKAFEKAKALAFTTPNVPWYGADLIQAYRLYLLAAANAPEIGAMNRLKEYKFLSQESKWRLAAAYYLVGQTQTALQMINELSATFPERNAWGNTYGSQLRDQAMALESLTIMHRFTEAEQLVKDIAYQLSQDKWYSTHSIAYSLIAVSKFSGANKSGNKIQVTGKAGNQNYTLNSEKNLVQKRILFQNGKAEVQFKNNGANIIYGRIINQGKPLIAQSTVIQNDPKLLLVNVAYLNTKGEAIDIEKIKQGTDFIAKVTIKNTGTRGGYNQMALSQIFPSGWEILNTRLSNSEGIFKSSASDYMDIKDDRVFHFFNIKQGETLTYYVQLNAAYIGKYYWPGVYCEAMYNNSISGGLSGKWVEVIP